MTTESPRLARLGTRPRFPFPRYPTGWFQVAWSDEIEAGKPYPLRYFGKDLVAFRDAEGKVTVLDAFCPHLGAHLGHGGKVENGTIACPFHAWKFGADGKCVEVPYATRIPPQAKLACWPVVEKNGCVFVWHDIDKAAPAFEVPTFTEYGDAGWTTPVKKEWKLRTHNQEMAENVVDKAHFKYLHGTVNMPATEVEFDGPFIHMVSPTTMTSRGGEVDGQIESHSHGLGFSTTRFTGIVETLLMGCVAPIDDEYVHVRFTFTVKKLPGEGMEGIVKGVGKAFVAEITRQLEQDAPVWENKVYLDRPMLCDGDGPVGPFRRWAAQFYPEWYKEQARAAFDAANGAGRRVLMALYEGFPWGWFVVSFSDELASGEVKPLRYFGKELVLFRTETGAPKILDAFCPHMGAHLGHGGKVVGESLRCPFHAWRFDGAGKCVEVPYATRIPPRAEVACWPVVEKAGLILVWHHPAKAPPSYEFPDLAEIGDEAWLPWNHSHMHVKTHPREIVENVADIQHFVPVHGTHVEKFENVFDGPFATQLNSGVAYPLGGGEDRYKLDATYFGPGIQVTRMDGVLKSLLVNAHTPIDENSLDLRFAVSLKIRGSREKTAGFAQKYVDNLRDGFLQDVAIWEHKVFRDRPMFVENDGPIGKLRRWYQQFYAEPAQPEA